MRVALVNAPLKSAVCDFGVGHQMPLGLLMTGGPLLRAGFDVTLIDAAREHLPPRAIADRVDALDADVVMISHPGATTSHPATMHTLAAIKARRPHVTTVYGGVFASYQDREILEHCPQVDVIVRGEGEATALELVEALDRGEGVQGVTGITWRCEDEPVRNPSRPAIEDLDAWPIGWELIEDWDAYRAFGLGRAAVVQWSRGCPHTCTYCGQWMNPGSLRAWLGAGGALPEAIQVSCTRS